MYLRSASRFFVAFYTLSTAHAVLQCEPDSMVSDACTSYSALDALNKDIAPAIQDITQNTDFFAYYRLNLYNKVCPFWSDESSICGNRACAVDTIEDEKDIPEIWRAEELSKLQGARAEHPGPRLQKERPKKRPLQYQLGENVDESCVLEVDDECDERDYCVPEDEGATSKGDYVSLVNNSERFTGYSGPGARQVWDAIYKENCFSKDIEQVVPGDSPVGLRAAKELRDVFQEYGRHNMDGSDELLPVDVDDHCIEQRAFYRIISGMHASISTHLCWDYFNQTTGEWVRNLECYKERLHNYPERISNLYFNYAFVTRAMAKLKEHLQTYTFCSGDPDQDYETKQKVLQLTSHLVTVPNTFDESVMFQDPAMLELKDDFKQRFRNVSRIMDCVGCDKCRLWGKVQIAGYGAALKVLFDFDENPDGATQQLRRTELVALVNTFDRLSHSLDSIQKFREAVEQQESATTSTPDEIPSIPSPSPPSNSDNDDDFADLDDDPYTVPRPRRPQLTLWEEFQREWDLVWRAYRMVLSSWINMPFKLSSIAVMELNRLWNYWLGLPVPGRSWRVHFPGHDEI